MSKCYDLDEVTTNVALKKIRDLTEMDYSENGTASYKYNSAGLKLLEEIYLISSTALEENG